VVVRRCHIKYTGSANAGKLHLEDVALKNTLTLNPGQKVWARQLNTELDYGRILNNGADLWILGIKTENRGYVIKTTNCGRTELLGGLIYPVKTFSTSETAFICEEAQQSLIFGATSYSTGKMYAVLVRETQNGVVKEMKYGGQIKLFLPLHAGHNTTCAPSTAPAPTPAPTGIAAGTYKIVAKHSGKALEVSGASTTNGALAQQWNYLGRSHQQWKVELVDGTYYKLTAVNSGKVLDVKGYSLSDGGAIHQYAWLNADNQKWSIISTGGGYYKIIGKQSGKALEVYQSSAADGGKVVQWNYGGNANQQWMLVPITSTARSSSENTSAETAPLLSLSPNPADESVLLEWQGMEDAPVTISITNAQGGVVHQEVVTGKTQHRIQTSQLKSGFYFVVLSSEHTKAAQKLLINR
jgi:hypothetical protein